ncbi:MAG: LamG domain-containing protein [Myxococcales bacterium FL481]|nr:MAG: LamG domain-containing protein [Myxococcales bacterium FL481]
MWGWSRIAARAGGFVGLFVVGCRMPNPLFELRSEAGADTAGTPAPTTAEPSLSASTDTGATDGKATSVSDSGHETAATDTLGGGTGASSSSEDPDDTGQATDDDGPASGDGETDEHGVTPSGTGSMSGTDTHTGDAVPEWNACDEHPESLVLCLSFDELTSGVPSRFVDGASFGNDATVTGSPALVAGVHDLAVELDGTITVAVEHDASLDFATFTVDFWVRPDEITSERLLLDKNLQYVLSVKPSETVCNNLAGRSVLDESLVIGEWSRVTCRADGERIELIVNGESVVEATDSTPMNRTHPLHIGSDSPDGGRALHGAVDSLRIWDTWVEVE